MTMTGGLHCAGVGCAHDPAAGTPEGTPLHMPRFDPRHIVTDGRHQRVVSAVEAADRRDVHDRDALLG